MISRAGRREGDLTLGGAPVKVEAVALGMLNQGDEAVHFVQRFLELMSALNSHEVRYVLVGGMAMNVHGFARATEDIDLFLAPEPRNIARLKAALVDVWADDSVQEITADDLLGEYPVVRYGPPEHEVYIDIMTRLGEETRYAQVEAEEIVVQGVMIRVATPRTLFEMKKDTLHPIDKDDANRLAQAFGF